MNEIMKKTILFLMLGIIAIDGYTQVKANLNDSIARYRKGYIIIKTTPNTSVCLEN